MTDSERSQRASSFVDEQIARARDDGRPQIDEMIDAVQDLSDADIANMRRQTEIGYSVDDRFIRQWLASDAALRLLRLVKKYNPEVTAALKAAQGKAKG